MDDDGLKLATTAPWHPWQASNKHINRSKQDSSNSTKPKQSTSNKLKPSSVDFCGSQPRDRLCSTQTSQLLKTTLSDDKSRLPMHMNQCFIIFKELPPQTVFMYYCFYGQK